MNFTEKWLRTTARQSGPDGVIVKYEQIEITFESGYTKIIERLQGTETNIEKLLEEIEFDAICGFDSVLVPKPIDTAEAWFDYMKDRTNE